MSTNDVTGNMNKSTSGLNRFPARKMHEGHARNDSEFQGYDLLFAMLRYTTPDARHDLGSFPISKTNAKRHVKVGLHETNFCSLHEKPSRRTTMINLMLVVYG